MCDCFAKTNEVLREQTGFKMNATIFFDGSPTRPTLEVRWNGDGKKPRGVTVPNMLPSFCPFCGEKYEEK